MVILHIVEAFGAGTLTCIRHIISYTDPAYKHMVAHSIREETPKDYQNKFPPNVELFYVPMKRRLSPSSDMKSLLKIISLIKKTKPDLVHCHSSKAGALGRIASFILGVPSCYSPHCYSFVQRSFSPCERSFFKFFEKTMVKMGSATIACGREEYKIAKEISGKKPVFLVPNSLNLMEIGAAQMIKVPSDKIDIGISGRFSIQNDPDFFLALAKETENICKWHWVGSGPDALPKNIECTGWLDREEALSFMKGLDIYVHFSQWEGLSYSILESMAMKKAVIASRIPSNEEIIEDGVTGFLASSKEEAVELIERIAASPGLRERIGLAAREYIEQNHNAEIVFKQFSSIYASLKKIK